MRKGRADQTPPDSTNREHLAGDAGEFLVSLPIDQSGSTKGEPIAAVACAAQAPRVSAMRSIAIIGVRVREISSRFGKI